MAMPGRTYAAPGSLDDKYRYSHNGQEKDNDIFIGALSAEYWEYDSRLGRRWNTDPIVKIPESPYACFSNNPVFFADPAGSNTVTPTVDNTPDPESSVDLPEVVVTGEDLSGKGGMKWDKLGEFFDNALDKGKEMLQQAKAFGLGALNAWGSNNFAGAGRRNPNDMRGYEFAAKSGQVFGDIISVVQGGAEIIGGAAGEVFGVALDATGVGSVFGVPLGVGSGLLIADGVLVAGTALSNLANIDKVNDNYHDNVSSSSSSSGSSSGGNYKKLSSNKAANEYAESKGYKDAHALKKDYAKGNESKFDIEIDSKTGAGRLISKDGKITIDIH
jgi:RHS repeat-associated protein